MLGPGPSDQIFWIEILNIKFWFLKNSGHDMYFFNQKFANGVNEVLSWFGINLMASF